jgi:hypothetical protein
VFLRKNGVFEEKWFFWGKMVFLGENGVFGEKFAINFEADFLDIFPGFSKLS